MAETNQIARYGSDLPTCDPVPTNRPVATVIHAGENDHCHACHTSADLLVRLALGSTVSHLCARCADGLQRVLRAVLEEATD